MNNEPTLIHTCILSPFKLLTIAVDYDDQHCATYAGDTDSYEDSKNVFEPKIARPLPVENLLIDARWPPPKIPSAPFTGITRVPQLGQKLLWLAKVQNIDILTPDTNHEL